jgi:uncharacterized hydrophobic protein (TIGR00271 family)
MTPIRDFLEDSKPNVEYYLLVVGAAVIALVGVLIDNLVILIASMIIAPLIKPILVASYGAMKRNKRHIIESTKTFLLSALIVIAVSLIGIFLLRSIALPLDQRFFISFDVHPLASLIVAVIGGIFATLGVFSSRIESIIVGVGVAVSLMPPLVIIGAGLGLFWLDLVLTGLIILGLNIIGIFAGSVIMFFMINKNAFNLRRLLEQAEA